MSVMATQTQAVGAKVRKPGLRARLDLGSGLLPYFIVIPTLLVILVVAAYPILNSIWLSMLDNPTLPSGATFVGLKNYGTFLGRGLVRAAILVPWAFPTIVSAYIWQLMYNDQTGIITYLLQKVHLLGAGTTLLGTSSGVIIASVVTDVWKTTPFMALLILAGLQVIPTEMYEAASVDGSSRWQQFWGITLPMLKNVLLIALLFRLLDAIRVFDLFYAFGQRSSPSMASFSYFLMFAGTAQDFAPGLAAAVIIFIFGIVISLIMVSMMRGAAR